MTILPVLMAGGSGTRLWPSSRRDHPKQFAPLLGEESLFQAACRRILGPPFLSPVILGNDDHRFLIAEQAIGAGIPHPAVVLEPGRRDTASVACTAALLAAEISGEQLVVLLPTDQAVGDAEALRAAILRGTSAANDGQIVLFGVRPSSPHTRYGYLEIGAPLSEAREAFQVVKFVEKPNREAAEGYVVSGRYRWNAGMFLFSAHTMVQAFEFHQPDILAACRAALAAASVDLGFRRLGSAYLQSPAVSVDYGVMEKMTSIAAVELDTDWNDCGTWSAIKAMSPKDPDGNALFGDVQVTNTVNSFVRSEGPHVVVSGLSGVTVVATTDAVLVTANDSAEAVRKAVTALENQGRHELLSHPRTHRPWGWFERLRADARYQVKRIMVKPGARLSLQSHVHRAEHWTVVSGSIEVTRGEEVFLLPENTSAFIPVGVRHRIANRGKIPAILIEVQSGSYLGEDDIVRYEDVYGRAID